MVDLCFVPTNLLCEDLASINRCPPDVCASACYTIQTSSARSVLMGVPQVDTGSGARGDCTVSSSDLGDSRPARTISSPPLMFSWIRSRP